MNKTDVKLIIKIAFKICFLYLLRTFMPSFSLRKYINSSSCRDYNKEILSEISKLKKVIQHCENKSDSSSNDTNDTSDSSSSESSESNDDDECNKIEKKKMNHEAIKSIKKEITTKLKEKYGDDTQVEFSEKSDLSDSKSDCDNNDKTLYSLKIKSMGNCDPDMKKFKESEIYVNTKSKTFMIRTKKGFETFPLIKKSVVKCEKV